MLDVSGLIRPRIVGAGAGTASAHRSPSWGAAWCSRAYLGWGQPSDDRRLSPEAGCCCCWGEPARQAYAGARWRTLWRERFHACICSEWIARHTVDGQLKSGYHTVSNWLGISSQLGRGGSHVRMLDRIGWATRGTPTSTRLSRHSHPHQPSSVVVCEHDVHSCPYRNIYADHLRPRLAPFGAGDAQEKLGNTQHSATQQPFRSG